MSLQDILEKIAAREDPIHLWNHWKKNKESPETFAPLLTHFKSDIRNQVNKFSGNQYVSKAALEKNVHDNFLKACQTYKPGESALRTHVINYFKKTNRFVGEQSNIGFIPEPRRQLVSKYNQAKDFLSEYLEREPTSQEIVKHMNEALVAEDKKPISVNEINTLKIELSKKDIHESSAMEEAEIEAGSKEHQAIMSLYHSTPIANGQKHTFRLTNDEHNIFKHMFPLKEDGSLSLDDALKPKQIATKLQFSQPKVSRSIKAINKKLKNTIGMLS